MNFASTTTTTASPSPSPSPYQSDTAKSVYLIFYTPDSEMIESEPYLNEMSLYTRMNRHVSNCMNNINSSWTTKTLEWSIVNQSINFTDNVCSLKVATYSENMTEEEKEEDRDDRIHTVLGSHIIEWKKEGEENVVCYRPFYSHVELMLEGNVTYTIRWGDTLKKMKKHYRSNYNIYTTIKLSVNIMVYDKIRQYCEYNVRNQTEFNYFGLYFNFLTPQTLKGYLCSNGHSYSTPNAVYCSEFITRLLCMVGIFKDITKTWQCNYGSDGDSVGAGAGDDGGNSDSPYDIWVDPATTSPNLLYLYIQTKKILIHNQLYKNNKEGKDPFIEDQSLFPFKAVTPYAYIMDSLLPTTTTTTTSESN